MENLAMVPDIMSTSPLYTTLWFLGALAFIAIGIVSLTVDEAFGFFLVAAVAIFFSIEAYNKIANYESEGTIKEFCTKQEKRAKATKDFHGHKYSVDNVEVCVEKAEFIAVDSSWRPLVKEK